MQGNYSVQIRGPCSVRAMKKYLVDLVTFRGLGTQQDCDIASTSACRLTILTLYFIEPFVSTSNCKIMRMSTLRYSKGSFKGVSRFHVYIKHIAMPFLGCRRAPGAPHSPGSRARALLRPAYASALSSVEILEPLRLNGWFSPRTRLLLDS